MTKKDYILIAKVIKEAKENSIYYLSYKMADALKTENQRFDYRKFLDACGIDTIRE